MNDADEILMKYRFMEKPHTRTHARTSTHTHTEREHIALQSGPLIDNNMPHRDHQTHTHSYRHTHAVQPAADITKATPKRLLHFCN